jgi:hypothetical protein
MLRRSKHSKIEVVASKEEEDEEGDIGTVELHLSGRWLSRLPVVRIRLALRVNLWRIPQNQLASKLPAIGSSTVECFGFQNFKSGEVDRFDVGAYCK